MAQQTAMQGLWEWIDSNYHEDGFNLNDARDMSLKLEKEQIIKAVDSNFSYDNCKYFPTLGEQYYNETYNKSL